MPIGLSDLAARIVAQLNSVETEHFKRKQQQQQDISSPSSSSSNRITQLNLTDSAAVVSISRWSDNSLRDLMSKIFEDSDDSNNSSSVTPSQISAACSSVRVELFRIHSATSYRLGVQVAVAHCMTQWLVAELKCYWDLFIEPELQKGEEENDDDDEKVSPIFIASISSLTNCFNDFNRWYSRIVAAGPSIFDLSVVESAYEAKKCALSSCVAQWISDYSSYSSSSYFRVEKIWRQHLVPLLTSLIDASSVDSSDSSCCSSLPLPPTLNSRDASVVIAQRGAAAQVQEWEFTLKDALKNLFPVEKEGEEEQQQEEENQSGEGEHQERKEPRFLVKRKNNSLQMCRPSAIFGSPVLWSFVSSDIAEFMLVTMSNLFSLAQFEASKRRRRRRRRIKSTQTTSVNQDRYVCNDWRSFFARSSLSTLVACCDSALMFRDCCSSSSSSSSCYDDFSILNDIEGDFSKKAMILRSFIWRIVSLLAAIQSSKIQQQSSTQLQQHYYYHLTPIAALHSLYKGENFAGVLLGVDPSESRHHTARPEHGAALAQLSSLDTLVPGELDLSIAVLRISSALAAIPTGAVKSMDLLRRMLVRRHRQNDAHNAGTISCAQLDSALVDENSPSAGGAGGGDRDGASGGGGRDGGRAGENVPVAFSTPYSGGRLLDWTSVLSPSQSTVNAVLEAIGVVVPRVAEARPALLRQAVSLLVSPAIPTESLADFLLSKLFEVSSNRRFHELGQFRSFSLQAISGAVQGYSLTRLRRAIEPLVLKVGFQFGATFAPLSSSSSSPLSSSSSSSGLQQVKHHNNNINSSSSSAAVSEQVEFLNVVKEFSDSETAISRISAENVILALERRVGDVRPVDRDFGALLLRCARQALMHQATILKAMKTLLILEQQNSSSSSSSSTTTSLLVVGEVEGNDDEELLSRRISKLQQKQRVMEGFTRRSHEVCLRLFRCLSNRFEDILVSSEANMMLLSLQALDLCTAADVSGVSPSGLPATVKNIALAVTGGTTSTTGGGAGGDESGLEDFASEKLERQQQQQQANQVASLNSIQFSVRVPALFPIPLLLSSSSSKQQFRHHHHSQHHHHGTVSVPFILSLEHVPKFPFPQLLTIEVWSSRERCEEDEDYDDQNCWNSNRKKEQEENRNENEGNNNEEGEAVREKEQQRRTKRRRSKKKSKPHGPTTQEQQQERRRLLDSFSVLIPASSTASLTEKDSLEFPLSCQFQVPRNQISVSCFEPYENVGGGIEQFPSSSSSPSAPESFFPSAVTATLSPTSPREENPTQQAEKEGGGDNSDDSDDDSDTSSNDTDDDEDNNETDEDNNNNNNNNPSKTPLARDEEKERQGNGSSDDDNDDEHDQEKDEEEQEEEAEGNFQHDSNNVLQLVRNSPKKSSPNNETPRAVENNKKKKKKKKKKKSSKTKSSNKNSNNKKEQLPLRICDSPLIIIRPAVVASAARKGSSSSSSSNNNNNTINSSNSVQSNSNQQQQQQTLVSAPICQLSLSVPGTLSWCSPLDILERSFVDFAMSKLFDFSDDFGDVMMTTTTTETSETATTPKEKHQDPNASSSASSEFDLQVLSSALVFSSHQEADLVIERALNPFLVKNQEENNNNNNNNNKKMKIFTFVSRARFPPILVAAARLEQTQKEQEEDHQEETEAVIALRCVIADPQAAVLRQQKQNSSEQQEQRQNNNNNSNNNISNHNEKVLDALDAVESSLLDSVYL